MIDAPKQLDEYELGDLLGSGGMAQVYHATDLRLQRPAAVKLINPALRNTESYRNRFEHEARAVAQLNHPNIVQVYRYGEADDLLYMAMQFVEGQHLGDLLAEQVKSENYLSLDDVVSIVEQVCAALDYAHQHGVFHRDIKPSNIIQTPDGRIVLVDFGLALLSEVGTLGEALGTPTYLAPEQAMSSQNVVAQSDLYALGVIVFQLLTHRLPFPAVEEPLDMVLHHLETEPYLVRRFRPNLTPSIEQAVNKLLAKRPQDRYASGADFANAFSAAVHASPLVRHLELAAVNIRADAQMAATQLGQFTDSKVRPALTEVGSKLREGLFQFDDVMVQKIVPTVQAHLTRLRDPAQRGDVLPYWLGGLVVILLLLLAWAVLA